jgi:hypothetical protein
MDMFVQTTFQTTVVFVAALGAPLLALFYFRNVRLERPALGVFNTRDILLILAFILSLPFLYLVLPSHVLTGMLVLTFCSALYIAGRPFLSPRLLWPLIALLVGGDIIVTQAFMGTGWGWQLYWVFNNMIVLAAVVGVSNLYVQGGMRLSQVAWLSLILAFYDAFFVLVIPVSPHLADRFHGQALDAALGWIMGPYSSNIGIGDLLIFALFLISACKGFGRKGVFASVAIIAIFGALLPSLSSVIILPFVHAGNGFTIPVQTFLGPAALLTYSLLRRSGKERSIGHWWSAQAAQGHEPIRVTRRVHQAVFPAALNPIATLTTSESKV